MPLVVLCALPLCVHCLTIPGSRAIYSFPGNGKTLLGRAPAHIQSSHRSAPSRMQQNTYVSASVDSK
eukprot:11196890-Alexandrium_andersonii.AAC.1